MHVIFLKINSLVTFKGSLSQKKDLKIRFSEILEVNVFKDPCLNEFTSTDQIDRKHIVYKKL